MKTRIVVGYDQTPPGKRALLAAAREAAARGAELTVVNAYHWMPVIVPAAQLAVDAEEAARASAEAIVAEGVRTVRSAYPELSVIAKAEAGAAARILADTAHGADLLVVGN